MFETIAARIRKARAADRTARELQRLSDRELADIGLTRFSIPSVVRGMR
jgi:uncharacterized protein YjiS (DUF1127 family)